MALRTHRWSRADLDRLPDDGNRYEIIEGALLVTPAPRPAHDIIVDELGWLLGKYCRDEGIGTASHSRPVMVTETSHVEPDIVVRPRVVPPPERWDDAPLPLLIVEVLSESTRRSDLVTKRAFYMENQVAEYWIVDCDARTVVVVTPTTERTESGTLRWRPAGAYSALEIDLPAWFAEVFGPTRQVTGHRDG